MSEQFKQNMKVKYGIDTKEYLETIATNSGGQVDPPIYKELIGQGHYNQTDLVILTPIEQYLLLMHKLPHSNFEDLYLLNAWLGMHFLEEHSLCSHPQYQKHISLKLEQMQNYFKSKLN